MNGGEKKDSGSPIGVGDDSKGGLGMTERDNKSVNEY